LAADESQLHEKLFREPAEATEQPRNENELLVTNTDDFTGQISSLNSQLNSLTEKTKSKNHFFGERLHLKRSDVAGLINLPSISPVKNLNDENLVSGFGVRINPFHKGNYHHDGLDIALPRGSEVLSTGNGKVSSFSYSSLEAGFGNYIEIDHGNGVITRYSHLEKISVTWGQKIKRGQVIALSGSSGGSVAPHLHYEVIKYGKNVDPLLYILEDTDASQHHKLALKGKLQNQSLD